MPRFLPFCTLSTISPCILDKGPTGLVASLWLARRLDTVVMLQPAQSFRLCSFPCSFSLCRHIIRSTLEGTLHHAQCVSVGLFTSNQTGNRLHQPISFSPRLSFPHQTDSCFSGGGNDCFIHSIVLQISMLRFVPFGMSFRIVLTPVSV